MPAWRHPGRPERADALLALALCTGAALEVMLNGAGPAGVVAAALGTLPLALRRRAPILACAGVAAAVVLGHELDDAATQPLALGFAVLVAGYSASAYAPPVAAVAGGLLAVLGYLLGEWWSAQDAGQDFDLGSCIVAIPWIVGWFAGPLRREANELDHLAASLKRERDTSARLAVAQERARLARELHDAIAHAVSAMVVQGAAAEAVLSTVPAEAARALSAVQRSGRDAVTELHRVLGILRATPAAGPARTPPAVTLADIPARSVSRRAPSIPAPVVDVSIALACLIAAEREVLGGDIYGAAGDQFLQALLLAVATLCLIVRRRFPVVVLLVSISATAAQQIIDGLPVDAPTGVLLAPLVAAFTVGERCSGRVASVAIAAAALIAATASAVAWAGGWAWSLFYFALFFGIFALTGHALWVHRRNAERLRTLTSRLSAERDALARLAVVEERTRTARDLHDAIAHGVSVMVLQAGGAEHVLATDLERARVAARAVQDTGREVLEELQRLLGVLDDGQAQPRDPQSGLSQLDTLIAHVRQAGLPVKVRIHGAPATLAAGVDASAYRVIQEALTNALKHAHASPTVVDINYAPVELAVEVRSEGGHARTSGGLDGGHGLVGMRERVELYGGELHAGPDTDGDYVVRARIPVGSGSR